MSKLPDLEAWAIFAQVAELRSFTTAAETLGVSKATVSKAVARLEARLGAQLFHRTSRRLSLTATGQALAGRAGALLSDAQAAEDAAREAAASPKGLVRLAAPMSFGIDHLGPALPDLLAACPELMIEIHLGDEQIDVVERGIDMALRIADLPDSSLRARRLADVPMGIFGAPAYFAARGRPEHPGELINHACFAYTNLPGRGEWRLTGPDGETIAAQTGPGPIRVNNGEAMLPALRAGFGLAMLPEFIVRKDLDAGTIERVLPGWTPPIVALHLVTPPGSLRPARVSAVIDFLIRRFSGRAIGR
jgi:DNA-binding transcriptional LysR family regulator